MGSVLVCVCSLATQLGSRQPVMAGTRNDPQRGGQGSLAQIESAALAAQRQRQRQQGARGPRPYSAGDTHPAILQDDAQVLFAPSPWAGPGEGRTCSPRVSPVAAICVLMRATICR